MARVVRSNVVELFGLAPGKLQCPGCERLFDPQGFTQHRDACDRSGYCTCGKPDVGWAGLECSACRRLIKGAVQEGITRARIAR